MAKCQNYQGRVRSLNSFICGTVRSSSENVNLPVPGAQWGLGNGTSRKRPFAFQNNFRLPERGLARGAMLSRCAAESGPEPPEAPSAVFLVRQVAREKRLRDD